MCRMQPSPLNSGSSCWAKSVKKTDPNRYKRSTDGGLFASGRCLAILLGSFVAANAGFVVFFVLQFLNWLQPMTWTADDRRWMKRVKEYATNAEPLEPEYVHFFNAGQKLYFWAIVVSAIVFLLSGMPMWFPETFGRLAVNIGYVLHDLAALVMLVGFIVHVYEGTAAQPGTFRSMTRGTVQKRWVWTHHPAWYRQATGRDPRTDCEQARERASGRPYDGETR